VTGEGAPFLHLAVDALSHIELFPRLPGARDYLERLGRGRQLIRMDFRGTGMSQREYEDHSPAALTDDVEAVVDALGIKRLILMASSTRVTPALGLITRRPDLVTRLASTNPWNVRPTNEGYLEDYPQLRLMESDWDAFVELTTIRNTGRRASDNIDTVSFVKRCIDQTNFLATLRAARPGDDWERAAKIDIPVLVVDFPQNVRIPAGRIQAFAQRFSRGHYISLHEASLPPPYGDGDLFLQALHEFLGPPDDPVPSVSTIERVLTDREREILKLLAAGLTQKQIAERLVISPTTVSGHVVRVYAKIGAHRRADAVSWAIRHGVA
jgi:DNA-binding CsgD family transcriptional regulator/pimeloyl-ACP methyl ester carboxylesterase